jgi:hypothetical protein
LSKKGHNVPGTNIVGRHQCDNKRKESYPNDETFT